MISRDQKPGFGGRQGDAGHAGKDPHSETDLVSIATIKNTRRAKMPAGRGLAARRERRKQDAGLASRGFHKKVAGEAIGASGALRFLGYATRRARRRVNSASLIDPAFFS